MTQDSAQDPTTTTSMGAEDRVPCAAEVEPGMYGTRSADVAQYPEEFRPSNPEQFPASVSIPSGEGAKGKCGTTPPVYSGHLIDHLIELAVRMGKAQADLLTLEEMGLSVEDKR